MRKKIRGLIRGSACAVVAMLLAACSNDSPANSAADVVFTNARVYTVNEAQPWAEAIATKGNEIVYVGDAAGAASRIGAGTS